MANADAAASGDVTPVAAAYGGALIY